MSTAFGSIGLNLMVTVLFKQAYDFTGDELDIGLLGLAQFIPAVLLVLVSGWVADRFDRRRVTALFLFARALCAGALVIYSMADATSLLPMFAIAFAFGAAEAMLSPARRAIPPLITTPTQFPHVIALWTATFTASAIVGPVLGGFLYSIGPAEAYAVAGVMELLAIVPVLMITYVRGAGADHRTSDALHGARGTALRASHPDRAGGDLARPVRGVVRRRDRADPRRRRRASRSRRHRLRVAAGRPRDRCRD